MNLRKQSYPRWYLYLYIKLIISSPITNHFLLSSAATSPIIIIIINFRRFLLCLLQDLDQAFRTLNVCMYCIVPLWEEVDYAQFWRDIRGKRNSLRAVIEVIHRISPMLSQLPAWLPGAVRKKEPITKILMSGPA